LPFAALFFGAVVFGAASLEAVARGFFGVVAFFIFSVIRNLLVVCGANSRSPVEVEESHYPEWSFPWERTTVHRPKTPRELENRSNELPTRIGYKGINLS
jgi:hypothetical protein